MCVLLYFLSIGFSLKCAVAQLTPEDLLPNALLLQTDESDGQHFLVMFLDDNIFQVCHVDSKAHVLASQMCDHAPDTVQLQLRCRGIFLFVFGHVLLFI